MDSKTNRNSYGKYDDSSRIKGVDSCAIEGFEKEKVEEILGLDLTKYRLSVIIPLDIESMNNLLN